VSVLPIEIKGDVAANDLRIDPVYMEKSRGVIILQGRGNVISIATSRPSPHVRIHVTGGCTVELEANSFIADLEVSLLDQSVLRYGSNSFAIGKARLFSHEKALISIGKDCLIGGGLHCLTSDMHSIIDLKTDKRINPPGDIIVEDRVWLGTEVRLLKSTLIGTGSIVGVGSTVTGEFPPNCVILGYPARAVKTGVTWAHERRPIPQEEA
jgi:acetyltransferase-like isoleucine patch superfamily enzyme